MLHVRQLIPALSIRNTHGRLVHPWDFKAKQNLVIAFLDVGCAPCNSFIQVLVNHTTDLREKEAVTLLVFPSEPEPLLCDGLPDGMIVGSYIGAYHIEDFLREGALVMHGFRRRAIFVTDRYGEISGVWITEKHEFPTIDEILSALNFVEIACEECSVPIWPAEE